MINSRFHHGAIIIAICVTLDQVSKIWIELDLPFQQIVPLIPFIALYRTWNEGVAFSFLSGYTSFSLVLLAVFVVGIVIWLWLSSPAGRIWLDTGYALITGGAIGNIIDRAAYGHVVDFILLYSTQWSFAIFNMADSFISIGITLIIIDEIRDKLKHKKPEQI